MTGVYYFDASSSKTMATLPHFPSAMKAVFEKIDEPVDFEPEGDLNLKPWLGDSILPLPKGLEIPLISPIKPYDEQLDKINKQVGAQYLRRPMVDTSGASRMDPKSQVTELHRSLAEVGEQYSKRGGEQRVRVERRFSGEQAFETIGDELHARSPPETVGGRAAHRCVEDNQPLGVRFVIELPA